MARYDFGGTLADFVVTSRRLGGLDVLGLASATLTFWSAQSGGTRYTDLVLNGSAVTSISVAADGQVPKFQGPDGVTEMWADGGAPRVRVVTLQGAPGPAGKDGTNGLPGVNAVANDAATASYITTAGSATQIAADGRYSPTTSVAAVATASATLTANRHTPVDATSAARTMTLPTAAAGTLVSVEKTDASTNAVNVTGTLRGTASSTIALTSQYDARTFLSEGGGSWRPVSDHRTKTSLDATYVAAVVMSGTGIDPTGAADSTSAMQAKLDAAASSGASVRFPAGTFKHDGTLTYTGSGTIDFDGGAWLKPTAGWGLKVTGPKATLNRPRVRYDGGNVTTGIFVSQSPRVTINEPTVWLYANVTSTLDGIVYDDNSYWGKVYNPHFRKDSGTLTGTFRRTVAFTNQSNASSVIAGDLAHATTGVYMSESNGVLVDGTAFEAVADGVEIAGTVIGCSGARVVNTRHESCTNSCINITSTVAALESAIQFDNIMRMSTVPNLVLNPNNLPVHYRTGGYSVRVAGGNTGDGSTVRDEVTVGDNQSVNPWVLKGRLAFGRMVEWTRNGELLLLSNSSAWPTTTDTVGVLKHFGGNTYLHAVNPTGSSGRVILGVGNGAGANKDVVGVGTTYVRPEADNVTYLGFLGTNRWRRAHIEAGTIKALSTKTGNYTITDNDYRIITNGAAVTITLPDPTGTVGIAGREFVVKNINAAACTVVSAGTTKTIDGAASVSLAQWVAGRYVSDGTQWLTA